MADKTRYLYHIPYIIQQKLRNYTHNLINKHQLLRYSFIITLSSEYITRCNSPQIISKFLCIQNFIKTFASNHRIIFIPSPSQTQMENHSFCKNFSSVNPPREIKWRVKRNDRPISGPVARYSTPRHFEKAIHPRDNSLLLFRFPTLSSPPNAERIRVERRDLRKKKCGHGS